MLFLAVVPAAFLIGALLAIIGIVSLGSSFVILNSFLPTLAAAYPSVNIGKEEDSASLNMEPLSPDLAPNRERSQIDGQPEDLPVPVPEESTEMSLKFSNMISSKGVGLGYAAAVFVQILSILLLFTMSKLQVSHTLPLRMVLFLVGSWWVVFTIPASLWLRDRPGPPLPSLASRKTGTLRNCTSYISFAWRSVWKTIKVAIKLREVVKFLIAWFLLSDAIATVSGTAILFARTELKMGTVAIALLSITATSAGILGAFIWPVISRGLSLRTNRTIIA